MISARAETENEREAYYVQIGSWDMHSDLHQSFSKYLSVVDQSLARFRQEMVNQGLWDSVVVATASDFGRTVTSNGLGTDHGWGGHYFIMVRIAPTRTPTQIWILLPWQLMLIVPCLCVRARTALGRWRQRWADARCLPRGY